MQIVDGNLLYSATDLVGFLECGHLTSLERAAVSGHLERPVREDPVLDRITQRGQLHEERFLEALEADGVEVVRFDQDPGLPFGQRLAEGRDLTLDAMRAGADVIYQAVLFDGKRLGFADFLRRIPQPSGLGGLELRGLGHQAGPPRQGLGRSPALYVLGAAERNPGPGARPDAPRPGGVQRETVSFRFADYAAYHRLVAREFEATLNGTPVYPPATAPRNQSSTAPCAAGAVNAAPGGGRRMTCPWSPTSAPGSGIPFTTSESQPGRPWPNLSRP